MPAEKSLAASILTCSCPRCRKGKLFLHRNPYNLAKVGKMPPKCSVCGQDFVIEPGFFFGAAYVSYAINAGLMIASFLILFFGFGLKSSQFVPIIVGIFLVLTPLVFRLSRSVWIHVFVKKEGAS